MLAPGHVPYPAARPPEDLALKGTEPLYRYLAVPFDAAARRGAWRSGSAELELTDATGTHTLRFALTYGRSATPTWGTFRDYTRLPCFGSGELLVTDTAPDGIHLLLRARPEVACTVVVSQVEIRSGETIVASVAVGLTANLRPGVEAQVPLFVPLEAARRSHLDRSGLRAWLQLSRDAQEPRWVSWQIESVTLRRCPVRRTPGVQFTLVVALAASGTGCALYRVGGAPPGHIELWQPPSAPAARGAAIAAPASEPTLVVSPGVLAGLGSREVDGRSHNEAALGFELGLYWTRLTFAETSLAGEAPSYHPDKAALGLNLGWTPSQIPLRLRRSPADR